MAKLSVKRGALVAAVPVEINGEKHLLRFGTLALGTVEEQAHADAQTVLGQASAALQAGRINYRLTLLLLAAGLAHEAIEQGLEKPEWEDLAPAFDGPEGRAALIALIGPLGDAINLAYPKKAEPDPNAPPPPPVN